MYSAVLFLGATNTSSVQSIVAIERTVFYRERAAGMYSPLPYAFAQVKEPGTFTAKRLKESMLHTVFHGMKIEKQRIQSH